MRASRFTLLAVFFLLLPVCFSQVPATQVAEKAPLKGLVTMGAMAPVFTQGGHADNTLLEANVHPRVYSAVVLLFTWDELEHVEGRLDSTRIDHALNAVRAYNRKYPDAPVRAKLRIVSGWNTPAWVIAKAGGSVTLTNQHGSTPVGHFWTTNYRDAWKKLQAMLAEKYDSDPLLAEVAVSSCATVTAEPFVMPLTAQTIPLLHAAGFTDAAYKACLLGTIDDYSVWHHTAVDYTFNQFRDSDSGTPRPEDAFTDQVMESFREHFGSRGVLANHGLQTPLAPRAQGVYAELKKLGAPIEFQTISPHVDWNASVELGVQSGATEIEIWNTTEAHGATPVSYQQLKSWAAKLRAVHEK